MPARRALLLSAALLPAAARAQAAWPARGLRIILPTPPGGAFDTTARLLQEPLARLLGQPVVVENRAGGAGVPAMQAVLQSGDGHTVGLVGSSHAANAALVPNLPFDPVEGIRPVALLARWPNVIACHPSQPWRNLAELAAAARARPGSISWASAGIGLSQHLAGELFRIRAGIELPHVPYRGAGPALSDAMAGHVPLVVSAIASAAPPVRAGRLRALAVTGPVRSAALPEVPTVAEQGFPGFDVGEWIGIAGPRDMPAAHAEALGRALAAAIAEPDVQRRLVESGIETLAQDGAAFGAFLRAQVEVLGGIIRTAGIRAE
ncbi:tripartite tricarboxylate transporter substrate-binding protein [Roseococcus sp. DSY-14]|uniref:tripartite tricarboxylate transporter substrate-binding protein n=1 Tax=Roseococcus sp. DSY-14 TaxID=3369650 RepID=UPI00387B475B